MKINQIKSLLLSHHHSTSALVSEILMSVLQTVQKNNRQFTYGQTVQKNCTGAFTVLYLLYTFSQSVLFPFILYLPAEEEEDSCVPLECFHILQMRHKFFEVLLMESEGTHNTCQLASREDGCRYAQASVF